MAYLECAKGGAQGFWGTEVPQWVQGLGVWGTQKLTLFCY